MENSRKAECRINELKTKIINLLAREGATVCEGKSALERAQWAIMKPYAHEKIKG